MWETSGEHAGLEVELDIWKTHVSNAEELVLRAKKGFMVSK